MNKCSFRCCLLLALSTIDSRHAAKAALHVGKFVQNELGGLMGELTGLWDLVISLLEIHRQTDRWRNNSGFQSWNSKGCLQLISLPRAQNLNWSIYVHLNSHSALLFLYIFGYEWRNPSRAVPLFHSNGTLLFLLDSLKFTAKAIVLIIYLI